MTRVSGFLSGNDETHDLVRKEMSGVGLGSWFARKLKSCLGCLLGWLVMMAIVLGIASFAVAKTGLIEIPVVSRFYHEPQPARLVIPASTSLAETLVSRLGAHRDLASGATAEFTFTLSESDLTRGIQDLRAAEIPGGFIFRDAQVAMLDGHAEIFVRYSRGEHAAPLRIRLVPALERKPIPLRVEKSYIGEMPVWHRAVDALFRQAMKTQLGNLPFADLITVKNLTLREGLADVTVTVSGVTSGSGGARP